MPIKLAGVYLLVGGLWIVLSDRVIAAVAPDRLTQVQTYKGLAFITCSALLIFGLAKYYLKSLATTEAALRSSEGRFQSFMQHAPAIAFIKDGDGRYVFVNKAASALHARHIELYAGRTDGEIFPPDEVRILRETDRAVLEMNRPMEATLRCTATAGEPSDWLLVEFPLTGEDGGRLIGGIAIDVTERTRAQEEVRRAKEAAEASNRAKDRFLSILSHELRTPLTPALLAASAMQKDGTLPEEVRAEAGMIREQVELEARLIDDLLDLTRIASGKLELHAGACDVHAVLNRALLIYRTEMESRRLKLSLELHAADHFVHGDPDRLQQCFWNLIGNAVKFTEDGGSVTLRTRNEANGIPAGGPDHVTGGLDAVASPGPASTLVVEIVDTGVGISGEMLPRLFNAFQQADQSLTRRYGGLGLGLSICKAIVSQHGGNVAAASAGNNRGATFTVRLPTVESPVAGRQPATPVAPAMRAEEAGDAVADDAPRRAQVAPARILLVEDDSTTRDVLARLLRSAGHEVHRAASAAAAVEAVTASPDPFDVLVSDIGLPDASGWDLMQRLGDRRPRYAVAVSGYGTEADIEASRAAGFQAHLTKPIEFDELLDVLARAAEVGQS